MPPHTYPYWRKRSERDPLKHLPELKEDDFGVKRRMVGGDFTGEDGAHQPGARHYLFHAFAVDLSVSLHVWMVVQAYKAWRALTLAAFARVGNKWSTNRV